MTTTIPPAELAGALLTPAEVRALLNVSDRTLYRYAARGVLVPLRLPGGHRRYRHADVAVLVDAPPPVPAAGSWPCPLCQVDHVGACPRQGTLI